VICRTSTVLSTRNDHGHCLLCGERNPSSLKLAFQGHADGSVTTRFQAGRDLQGYSEILHGGVIASLLDAAMTHCLFHRGVQGLTADLHVRYVQAVPCGALLEIRAASTGSHPPLHRLRADMEVEGRVVAWAEAKFLERPPAS